MIYEKCIDRKKRHEPFFKPFDKLKEYQVLVNSIEKHLREKKFKRAEQQSRELISLVLEGLRYFET
jgi:hypothetical protein